jgi:hypothetical protein
MVSTHTMLKPAPSVVVQLILRWASITTHPVAGNSTDALLDTGDELFETTRGDTTLLLVVYFAVTAVPSGPKLDPKMVTVWFPDVNAFADPGPSNAVITGDPYELGPARDTEACDATTKLQYNPSPIPGAVTHCSCDEVSDADTTVQFNAV